MAGLMHLKDSTTPKIRNIGLTNFDTEHMVDLIDQDAPIVSNQVAYLISKALCFRLLSFYLSSTLS